MPRLVVISRDGKIRNCEIDRFGFYNPLPFIYESPLNYWHLTRDRMNAVDDDRFSTTHPKSSMVSTMKGLSRMDID